MEYRLTDGVCARHLLTDHQSDGDENSLSVTRDREHFSDQILMAASADKSPFVIECSVHLIQLHLNVRMIWWKVGEFGKDRRGFFPVVLTC
jgi:hypothetical protein